MLLEVCCGSYEDGMIALEQGANRIELNSALSLGGLTPSFATFQCLKEAMKEKKIPIIAMIRPRGAGFHYTTKEIEVMFEDAKIFLEAGVDGLAFGFLTKDKTIDINLTWKMVQLIHSYGKEAVFHRAFDCVDDLSQAMEQLIHCQVDRVLTSGGMINVIEGIKQLTYLQARYGTKIEILAGCGVNEENVTELIQQTKVKQVHSSCKDYQRDETTTGTYVNYAYHKVPHENDYECVSAIKVKKLVERIKKGNK